MQQNNIVYSCKYKAGKTFLFFTGHDAFLSVRGDASLYGFPEAVENVNILRGGGDAFFAIMGDRPKGPPHAAEKGVVFLVLALLFS